MLYEVFYVRATKNTLPRAYIEPTYTVQKSTNMCYHITPYIALDLTSVRTARMALGSPPSNEVTIS